MVYSCYYNLLKEEAPQARKQLKDGVVKSIINEETRNLVESMAHRLDTVIASTAYATKCEVFLTLI